MHLFMINIGCFHFLAFPLMLAVMAPIASDSWACACCTNRGDRTVATRELDQSQSEIIKQFRFAPQARLSYGEMDLEDVRGITVKSGVLNIRVDKNKNIWKLSFDDRRGNTGTLAFSLPRTISIFEVDTRSRSGVESLGGGPLLYKEWKLTTGATGDGMLQGSVGRGQRATIIFHGRGNHCTSVEDFNAWTLVLWGPKAHVSLFGQLGQK